MSESPLTGSVALSRVCVHVCVLGQVYRSVNLEHSEVLLIQSDVAPEDSCKLKKKIEEEEVHIHIH